MTPKKPSLAPTATWLYDLILSIFAPLLDLFFREIQVRGAWRVPTNGAVILVAAPHANQVRWLDSQHVTSTNFPSLLTH